MEKRSILFVGLALIFVAVSCSSDTTVDVEANVVSTSISNLNFTDTRFGGSELVTNDSNAKKIEGDANKQSNSRGNDDADEGKGELGDASKSIGNYGESNSRDKTTSDETSKEALSTLSRKKEGFHGEECDPSNMCTDKEDQFVACLRVPGNDSPHLSLLIQNKGKSPLLVTISAPAFVRLEKNKIQLRKNEDKKVKVTIKDRGSDENAIILTAGEGRCSLDLKDLAAQNAGNDDSVAVSRTSIMNFRSQTLTVIFIIVFALVLVAVFIHFYRSKSLGNKYQRLDAELPISSNGSKADKETDDGWNNDWGDDWDVGHGDEDEEAPKTPVLPVTPRVSSRGLASRKLSKEGWKD